MTVAEFVTVRLVSVLLDPKRCDRIMLLVLAAYAALWALYG
jgi:hypothetical protein